MTLRLHVLSDERFTCTQCGRCCHDLDVRVTPAEKARLEAARALFPEVPEMFAGEARDRLARRPGGACVFLEGTRCLVHARLGLEQKPLPCRFFPYTVVRADDEVRVGLRFNCKGVLRGDGQPLGEQLAEIGGLARAYYEEREPGPAPAVLAFDTRGIGLGARELEALHGELDAVLAQPRPFDQRLAIVDALVRRLREVRLRRVEGARFAELLAVLRKHEESAPAPPRAGWMDRLLLALYASASWQLVDAARGKPHRAAPLRLFRLRGTLVLGEARIDLARLARTPIGETERSEALLGRFARAKVHGRSYADRPTGGLPFARGWTLLCLQLGTTRLLARAHAVARDAAIAGADDVARALHDVEDVASHRGLLDLWRVRLPLGLLDRAGVAAAIAL